MLSIDWRAPAAYRHTRDLPATGFAWEYLRRNGDYRSDYKSISAAKLPGAQELDLFAKRWGLRFPDRPRYAA